MISFSSYFRKSCLKSHYLVKVSTRPFIDKMGLPDVKEEDLNKLINSQTGVFKANEELNFD